VNHNSYSTTFYTTFLNETIGSREISEHEKQESYAKELLNWKNMEAFEPIAWKDIPKKANIIGSHVVWRRKPDGTVKARICPWGHRDIEKAQLRTDAPCMSEEVFRLVMSLAAEFKWTIAEMDITAAYLQAKGFEREIFVRPPAQENHSNHIWKLTKAAYGLADSGRLWYLTSDSAIVEKFGATRSKLEPTLYYSKNKEGNLSFLMVAQVDNYIYAGDQDNLKKFETFLHSEFDVGELEHESFKVFGCEINQMENYSITITQNAKMLELPNKLYRESIAQNRSGNDLATPKEITSYKSAIGKLLFIGRITQPIFLRIASHMATKTKKLLLHHLKDLEALIKYGKKQSPSVLFKSTNQSKYSIEVNSDASMARKSDENPREGFVVFRRNGDTVHPVYWCSRQLRRVARSSGTAETLASADAVDFGLYLQALLSEICYHHHLQLTTDSNIVWNNVTSTKKPSEVRNSIDLAAMREAFNYGYLGKITWSPGYYMVSDALTKDNRESASHLMRVLRSGHYPIHPEAKDRLSPKGGMETS